MSLVCWKNSKFKILNITIFKLRNTSKGVRFYLFGIPCYKNTKEVSKLIAEFKLNKNFDTRKFDQQIEDFLKPYNRANLKKDNKKIGFLATEIYDTGGHTKCIKDLIVSLSNDYEQILFLSKKSNSIDNAPTVYSIIKNYAQIYGIDSNLLFLKKKCKDFCNKIISSNIKTLLVYIHPDDIFGTAVLAYLKNTTDIKIIYFNHASHYPVLGMSFADVILEGMPTTQKITHEKRHFTNTKIIGLQSLPKDETIYYSNDELQNLRHNLGIKAGELVTMSGGSAYKFFDDEKNSDYFEMIKNLLAKEPRLKHVIISEFDSKQNSIIQRIFSNSSELKNRIVFLPYQTNFDKYFQMADVFIDSFPVSSALTQVDLMRNRVASVVKINKEIPEFSFDEYQMPDYPYMFERIQDMQNAILDLLHDETKRKEIISKNYEFWLKTYESSVVRDKYIKIIEAVKWK